MKLHFLNTLVIVLLSAFIANAQNYQIGDLITNNDGSQGIVFYVNEDRTDGWMIALHDLNTNVWGVDRDIANIPNLDTPIELLHDTDGMSNTKFIRSYHSSIYYIEEYGAGLVDYEHGWYIPAAGQLMKLCSVLSTCNDKIIQAGGEALQKRPYYSSSESFYHMQVWSVNMGSDWVDWGGEFVLTTKNAGACFRSIRNIQNIALAPLVGSINQPKPFCAGGSPIMENPMVNFAITQGWQISPTIDFSDPIPYNGEPIDIDKDGWFLRYYASNEQGTAYSNTVTLSVLPAPYISEIQGKTHIYYLTNGTFNYSIDPVEGCLGYEWHIDNPNWQLDASPSSPECSVNLNSPGVGTLRVRVYTECGYIERNLYINHDVRPDIVIYPNPTLGDFKIVLYGLSGETIIEIYDYLGQFIGRSVVDTDVDGTVVPYTLAGKTAGVYTVLIINNNLQIAKSVIKNTDAGERLYYLIW